MRFVYIVLVALAAATGAQAQNLTTQDVKVMTTIRSALDFDATCRGGIPGTFEVEYACKMRERLGKELNRLGWCYGKRGQIGADMAWHRCTRRSYR
jgi:hypothetical protein